MTGNIDMNQALSEAEARRQAAEAEKTESEKTQLSTQVGELLLDAQQMITSSDINHDTKMVRLAAARSGVNGGNTPEAQSQPALSDEEQELLEAFRTKQVIKTEFGAWRDKGFTRKQKNFEAEQSPDDEADDTSTTEPTTVPAKKVAAKAEGRPAKKAAPPAAAKKSASAKSQGFLGKARDAGLKILDNAKQ